MEQAVEDRGGEDLVAEDGAPLRDDLVRGDEQAAPFVAARDELEKEVGAPPFKGQVPELLDDQQFRLAVKHQALGELAFGLGSRQGGEQPGGTRKEHGMAGFDHGAAQPDGEMRFAHTRRAKQEDVFGLAQKARRGELADEPLIDRRLKLEFEIVERLYRRKVRDLQRHRHARALFGVDSLPEDAVEKVEIGRLAARSVKPLRYPRRRRRVSRMAPPRPEFGS